MKPIKLCAILILFCTLVLPMSATASPAREQLRASIDAILDVLKDEGLKADMVKRRAALRELIHQRFDFRKMSQLSLARHWRGRTPQEKDMFTQWFSQLLEDTYVGRIEAYTNERVIYTKERIKKNKAQISTLIVTQNIEIPIDYRMFAVDAGQWRVYDIVIEGVSLVGNYRSQFAQILDKGSFEDLVEQLRGKLVTP